MVAGWNCRPTALRCSSGWGIPSGRRFENAGPWAGSHHIRCLPFKLPDPGWFFAKLRASGAADQEPVPVCSTDSALILF